MVCNTNMVREAAARQGITVEEFARRAIEKRDQEEREIAERKAAKKLAKEKEKAEAPLRKAAAEVAAKAAAEAAEKAEKEFQDCLPPGLRKGGTADKIVVKVEGCYGFSGHYELARILEKDLLILRDARFWKPDPSSNSETTAEARYKKALDQKVDNSAALFRVCMASQAKIDPLKDHIDVALSDYIENFELHNAAFGELIPTWFKDRHHEIVTYRAYRTNSNPTALQDMEIFEELLEVQSQRPMAGLATGFPNFDRATGGLRGLMLLAGHTGVGKSLWVLNAALGVLEQTRDAGVLIYSLELNKTRVMKRILSRVSGIPYRLLASSEPTEEQQSLHEEALVKLKDNYLGRIRIVEELPTVTPKPLTLARITRDMTDFREESGVDQVVVIIDSLQKVVVEEDLNEQEAEDKRWQLMLAVQNWTRRRDLPDGSPVIVISEVRKSEYPGKRLTAADVRGSYHLAYSADCILLLEPQETTNPHSQVVPTRINVAKMGEGEERGDLSFLFHHTVCRFEAVTEVAPSASGSGKKSPPSKPSPTGKEATPTTSAVSKNRFAGKKPPGAQ